MKLLVTGAWTEAKKNFDILTEMGHEIVFMQNESEEIPVPCEDIEGIVCNGLFLHHDIQKFKNLSYIQLTSAGFDRVDMDYADKRGIKVFNARGVYSVPMAEFAVLGVLSLYKNVRIFLENQKNHKWEKQREISELCDKVVLVVGAGNVGTECAKRFKAFGNKVFAVDIIKPQDLCYDGFYTIQDLGQALTVADVVILTLPLTDKTRHLFDEKMIEKIKKGAVLVNISRGAVIDEGALAKSLVNGNLRGAVLDVFEKEPLECGHDFWDMENVIVTPHNSFVSEKNGERLKKVIIENLESWNGK